MVLILSIKEKVLYDSTMLTFTHQQLFLCCIYVLTPLQQVQPHCISLFSCFTFTLVFRLFAANNSSRNELDGGGQREEQ